MKKEIKYITKTSIRGIQLCCMCLTCLLLPGVKVCASASTDSVYFHIRVDSLGGIHTGRVLKLTYALVNSRFDKVSYPVFNDSIEVVSGPEQHKSSSYVLVNGVGSSSEENCFSYLVRFRESGDIQLPAASATVGNQTYTTPECRVLVHPAKVDRKRLKCSLNVERQTGNYAGYCATLTCNTRPDQNPPLLSINGKTIRPTGNSYSGSNGREEYVYRYYFTDKYYKVSCKELTFGGKRYKLRPQKSKKRY